MSSQKSSATQYPHRGNCSSLATAAVPRASDTRVISTTQLIMVTPRRLLVRAASASAIVLLQRLYISMAHVTVVNSACILSTRIAQKKKPVELSILELAASFSFRHEL